MSTTREVLELCDELGFDLAGVAPLEPPPDAGRFRDWLASGNHADMAWLERNADRIADPRSVLEGGRSILVVGLGHARPEVTLEGGGRVARYAAGRDYHNLIGKRLRKLARALVERGLTRGWRSVVDAGPLLERSHASRAGLGFPSKAANLLHRDLGPWFFLGELLLDADLDPTDAPALGSCGTCTACIDACPTDAIRSAGVVDARRCISYQTIENRGSIPPDLRARLDGWVFGCDVCSQVCPWGKHAPDASERFGTHRVVDDARLVDWLQLPRSEFLSKFEGSPLRRPGPEGVARNAALALAAHPHDEGRDALVEALSHPAALVREAVGWSLAAAHAADRGVREVLARAVAREVDPSVRTELERWHALAVDAGTTS